MNETQFVRELERLFERLEKRLVKELSKILRPTSPPGAGKLTGTFYPARSLFHPFRSHHMSTMKLSASPPALRLSGAVLASAAIASITFQKVPAGGAALQVLQVNSAVSPGAGLQPSDLLFTDTSSTVGDDYTFFVTDTDGNAGAPSNDVVASAAPPAADPPAAGVLAGTFTP